MIGEWDGGDKSKNDIRIDISIQSRMRSKIGLILYQQMKSASFAGTD